MIPLKEKGHPKGSPIPNHVSPDSFGLNAELLKFQASHIADTFRCLPDTAATLAILAFYASARS